MWSIFIDHLTNLTMIICTVLSFVIPFTVNKINKIFHENTNPPWKRNNSD